MSLETTPPNDTAPRPFVKRTLRAVAAALPTLARLLMGLMFTMGGWTWLHRADPGLYNMMDVLGL